MRAEGTLLLICLFSRKTTAFIYPKPVGRAGQPKFYPPSCIRVVCGAPTTEIYVFLCIIVDGRHLLGELSTGSHHGKTLIKQSDCLHGGCFVVCVDNLTKNSHAHSSFTSDKKNQTNKRTTNTMAQHQAHMIAYVVAFRNNDLEGVDEAFAPLRQDVPLMVPADIAPPPHQQGGGVPPPPPPNAAINLRDVMNQGAVDLMEEVIRRLREPSGRPHHHQAQQGLLLHRRHGNNVSVRGA